MKTERLEYLGRIYCKLDKVLENEHWHFFDSKHGFYPFLEHFVSKEITSSENELQLARLQDLFDALRHIKTNLEEILYMAQGDENEH